MNDVETKRSPRIFLSYVSADKDSARIIANALKERRVSTWFDESEIMWGADLAKSVETAARSSDYILLLLSPAAVNSQWVHAEMSFALSRELQERAIRLIPVLLADCEIPLLLRDRQYLDMELPGVPLKSSDSRVTHSTTPFSV